MVAAIVHDINTPITIIQGYSESLLEDDETLSEEKKEYLRVINKSEQRVSGLVFDMKMLSEVEKATFSINNILVEAVSVLKLKIQEQDLLKKTLHIYLKSSIKEKKIKIKTRAS